MPKINKSYIIIYFLFHRI